MGLHIIPSKRRSAGPESVEGPPPCRCDVTVVGADGHRGKVDAMPYANGGVLSCVPPETPGDLSTRCARCLPQLVRPLRTPWPRPLAARLGEFEVTRCKTCAGASS